MAKRKNKRIFNKLIKIFVPIILLIIAFFINIYEVKIKQGIISSNEIGTTIFIENSQILESKDNLYVYYIDQTTPNMIQTIKTIFARKPLISRGI